MSTTLKCRNVSKSFLLQEAGSAWRVLFRLGGGEHFTALRDVTIDVPKGQFVGVLGRNGAGKSTLLRTIGGVYAPDSGVVNLNGDLSALYELGLTGNENLTGRSFTGRWFQAFSSRKDKREDLIADVLEFSELGEAFDRPIRTYSAGMKARLFFALATARQSDVYIIDEVLSVGDEYFQNKCWRRIRQRLSGGASGIIATHDWSAVLRLCPTSYIIENGKSVSHGASSAIVREYLGLSTDSFDRSARFHPEPAPELRATSLETFSHEFDVVVDADHEVSFAAAIECFVAGFGWEHVLHVDAQPIGFGPGVFKVRITVPDLPLKAGEYSLALFLTRDDGAGGKVGLDARSWTYNDGVRLLVEGRGSPGAVRWPLELVSDRPHARDAK